MPEFAVVAVERRLDVGGCFVEGVAGDAGVVGVEVQAGELVEVGGVTWAHVKAGGWWFRAGWFVFLEVGDQRDEVGHWRLGVGGSRCLGSVVVPVESIRAILWVVNRETDSSVEALEGGSQTPVRRVGGVVYRQASPWSPTVMALLRHLAEVGFPASPRPVGSGFDADGNEALSFVVGESPQPYPWSDEAAAEVGRLLGELHRATASFTPPADARWKDWYGRHLGDNRRAIGHGDLGPWNIIARDGLPVALVDWDTAGPIDPTFELAQVAWLNAQLHDDDLAERLGLANAAGRARQLAAIVDSYGLGRSDRAGFVDKMVEFAIHSARSDAIEYHVTPESRSAVGDDGFPILWGITWRTRSASWMLRNRHILEAAIGA